MQHAVSFGLGMCVALLSSAETALGQGKQDADPVDGFRFEEVSAEVGIGPYHPAMGLAAGVAAADFDDDGDVDVYVPTTRGQRNLLYVNQGDGQFVERARELGVASTVAGRAALWFDYDGDRLLDLVVANDDPRTEGSYELFHQNGFGTFVDVTVAAGLDLEPGPIGAHRGGMCAGDYDRDGDLDLFAASWNGTNRLLRNCGDGTFEDVAQDAGVLVIEKPWQPMMVDLNDDLWPDIYIAVDFRENRLWMNQGDGTFVDMAEETNADVVMHDMGLAIVDYDDDGDFDLYTSNIFDHNGSVEYNMLLENLTSEGELRFEDVSVEQGVAEAGWGWGISALDADLDGWVDFAATNGFYSFKWDLDRSRLFLHDPEADGFQEVGRDVGFDDSFWGSGLISFDHDLDGDPDLLQACLEWSPEDGFGGRLRMLENRALGGARHSLLVRPRMNGPNHRAIGAVARVSVDGREMTRLISAGTSLLSQEPAEALFGLGAHTSVDRVRIEYPDGSVRELFDVAADQVLTVYAP